MSYLSNESLISTCIGCGCDDLHACLDADTGYGCHWLRTNGTGEGVCSECSHLTAAWDKEHPSQSESK